MKSIFLKILASASLLLGLLGPQVASGSTVSVVEPESIQIPIEVVSSSPSSSVVVSEANNAGLCGFSGLSLERIDWLIWQACDSVEVKTQVPTQSLQVVSAPSDVPDVKVASAQTQDLYTPDGLTPVRSFLNLPAIPQSIAFVIGRLKLGVDARSGATKLSFYDYHADRQNLFTTISMRC